MLIFYMSRGRFVLLQLHLHNFSASSLFKAPLPGELMEQFLQQTVVKLSPHSVKLIITCTPEQTYQTLYHTIQIIDAIDLLLI